MGQEANEIELQEDDRRGLDSIAVEILTGDIDVRSEVWLKATISCGESRDLSGATLVIKDHEGKEVATAEVAYDGYANRTERITVTAPATPGIYEWTATVPAFETDTDEYGETSAPIQLEVNVFKTHVLVWDIPPTIVTGETFRLKVGMRSSSGGSVAGRAGAVIDHNGNEVAAFAVGDETRPGTDALYFAELSLQAPAETDQYQWRVMVPASDDEPPHREGTAAFKLRVVPRPDSLVTIEVVDRENETPIKGCTVVMHPYRAQTDENGVAQLRVPNGTYSVVVSGKKHIAARRTLEVNGDTSSRAALDFDHEPTEAAIWG
ncbi:MAG: hypothetical protein KIS68_07655 [Bauldia sp.]|nr:hypothetical protein [Bauldia sp.]